MPGNKSPDGLADEVRDAAAGTFTVLPQWRPKLIDSGPVPVIRWYGRLRFWGNDEQSRNC